MDYKCLIIDDEEMICQSTCEYFNIFDLPTTYVTSYDDALAYLEQHEVSIIILDINLGGHSGFELCKKIREKTGIPILFISARTSDDDILTALSIGGDDYITKPYTLSILLAKVKAILKRCEQPVEKVTTAEQPKGIQKICDGLELDYNYRQVMSCVILMFHYRFAKTELSSELSLSRRIHYLNSTGRKHKRNVK